MGSNVVTVGNNGGKNVFTFTSAGQDTGPLMFTECSRWSKWLFQLIGSGQNYAITVFGTIDQNTASGAINPATGLPYAEWFELPSPSTEATSSWNNPLLTGAQTCALYCNVPLVAIRATSASNINGAAAGSVALLALVSP